MHFSKIIQTLLLTFHTMQHGLPHEKNSKEALNLGRDQIRTKPGSKRNLHWI